jgi:hypothetical protein
MKKIMSILLGLGLVMGAATVAFSQDTPAPAPKGKKKKKTGDRTPAQNHVQTPTTVQ